MDPFSELSNEMLIAMLDKRVELEAQNEAEIVDYVREVMTRRLYLQLGADSMFDFLTRARYKYSRNVAMRKLDAARVMQNFPFIKDWIADNEINLTQLGMLQTALRQKPAELELQAEVLEEIRNQTVENTQFILCEKLGIEVRPYSKVRIQKDGSRRVEITFSESEWKVVERAKELLSHSVPNGDPAKVLFYCAKFTVEKKDPAKPLKRAAKDKSPKPELMMTESTPETTPTTGVPARHRRKVSPANRRVVFQEQKGCQFQHPDGTYCGSRYQLQVDHIVPLWAGGSNELENLQILCGMHNREKFRREMAADKRLWQ